MLYENVETHFTEQGIVTFLACPEMQLIVDQKNGCILIKEGGSYSIDITRFPPLKKSDAMCNFLELGLSATKGAYFGNQNQSLEDRDAAMLEIDGLRVFGVDEHQDSIIEGIERIGAGPEATCKQLKEFLTLPFEDRPAFIGLDIDDTVLGLRPDKNKEELLKEGRSIAEALAQLTIEGTALVFFSDNDSQVTLKRVGYPLAKILQEKNILQPISIFFYASKMVTKLIMEINPQGEPQVDYDSSYGVNNRLNAKVVSKLSSIIGDVIENEDGSILSSGLIGDYYTQKLTQQDASGHYVRNENFYPNFKTIMTPKGNVAPPLVQIRDFHPKRKDAAMIAIVGLPPAYREELMTNIVESWK